MGFPRVVPPLHVGVAPPGYRACRVSLVPGWFALAHLIGFSTFSTLDFQDQIFGFLDCLLGFLDQISLIWGSPRTRFLDVWIRFLDF